MVKRNRWTEDQIPDLRGKVALITGANGGLGFEASRALAAKGSQVILVCRTADKGRAAAQKVQTSVPQADVETLECDLASLQSVRELAQRVAQKCDRLDLLVNNAGVMATPFAKTRDGFEQQMGVNHLAHFALTGLLLGPLLKAPAARIISVSSFVHWIGKIRFDDLHFEKGYSKWAAYGQSKLANLLFTYELDRRLKKKGAAALAAAAHPGYAHTNLQENRWWSPFNRVAAQRPQMGALPVLYAATSPEVKGGEYFGPRGLLELWGHPKKVPSSKRSYDPAAAERLWTVSQELTGVAYL